MDDAEKLEVIRKAWSEVLEDYDCGCSQPCCCAYVPLLKVLDEVLGT